MTNIDELARDIYDAFNDADPTSCIDPFALDQRIIIDGHFSMRAVAALLAVKMMERGLIGMSKPHNSPAREAVEQILAAPPNMQSPPVAMPKDSSPPSVLFKE